MMKQPKIITRLEMAQREVARLTAERDALAAALAKCREVLVDHKPPRIVILHSLGFSAASHDNPLYEQSMSALSMMDVALALDPLCASALARVAATEAVVQAAIKHRKYRHPDASCRPGCDICRTVDSLDPLSASAAERARLVAVVVEAAKRECKLNQSGLCDALAALAALDAHDKEAK